MKKNIIIIPIMFSFCFSCSLKIINFDKLDEYYDLHTDKQIEFIECRNLTETIFTGNGENSKPNSIKLQFENPLNNASILVSKNKDMQDAKTYTTKFDYFNLKNLEIDTRYYVQIKDEEGQSEIQTFYNNTNFFRNIDIDGATNVRDIGGKVTEEGRIIKQGLVYRGANFSTLTPIGKKTITDDLKLETEIDLRADGEASNSYAFPNYQNVQFSYNQEMVNKHSDVKKVFDIFGDTNNYPIYFHCAIGTDRTGFIAYLLNGILGLSKFDSLKDYLFSNFGNIGVHRTIDQITFYTNLITRYNKESHKANVIEYLTNACNVSMDTITAIQDYLLI